MLNAYYYQNAQGHVKTFRRLVTNCKRQHLLKFFFFLSCYILQIFYASVRTFEMWYIYIVFPLKKILLLLSEVSYRSYDVTLLNLHRRFFRSIVFPLLYISVAFGRQLERALSGMWLSCGSPCPLLAWISVPYTRVIIINSIRIQHINFL